MSMLYKNLVETNHENCDKIEIAVNYYLNKARKKYGNEAVDKIGQVHVEFFDKGRTAAMAVCGKDGRTMQWVGIVQFSMHLVMTQFASMMKQIVPHEVAHLICLANRWDMGHGKVWRDVCKDLGGNAKVKHNYATIDGRLKNMYQAKTDTGEYWLTGKQMRMAASTGIVVRDATGRDFTLTKHSLTGNIKKL